MRRLVALLAAVALVIPLTGSSLAATKPPAPTCVPPAPGLTGWWSGDKTTTDAWGDNDARLVGGAKYGAGHVGSAFALNGKTAFVDVPDAPPLNPTGGVMTLSLWVKFNDVSGDQIIAEKWVQRLVGDDSTGWTLQKTHSGTIGFYSVVGGLDSAPVALVVGRWHHVAVRLDGSQITLFLDGAVIGQQGMDASNALALATAASLKFGHRGGSKDTPGAEMDQGLYLNGAIDEAQYWNDTALGDDQIRAIVAAGPTGTCGKDGPTTRTLQLGNNRAFDHPSFVATPGMADNKIGTAAGPIWDPLGVVSFYPFGFRWARVISDWARVEQTPGHYTIDASEDAVMNDYAAHGVSIIATLGNPDDSADLALLTDPAAVERYGEYVRFMVHHYKDRIRYFELLNEPIALSTADYLALARHAIPIIRAEDPDAKIVVPASSGHFEFGYPGYGPYGRNVFERNWFFGVLDSDLMPLVDAISWHPFYGNRADDPYYQGYPDFVTEIKTEAEVHGFRGEYIAEEMCWRSNEDTNVPVEPRIEGTLAEKYMVRTTVTHRGLGLVTVIAPSAYDWTAIQNTNVLLAGAQPTSIPVGVMSTATHVRQYAFSLPNGDRLVALWNDWLPLDEDPGIAATVTIGAKGSTVTAIDPLHGTSQELTTSASVGGVVIKGLLIKDYTLFLRIGTK
jgi:hypothetical protein